MKIAAGPPEMCELSCQVAEYEQQRNRQDWLHERQWAEAQGGDLEARGQ
ncbi:MAG: hypothetical protein ACRDP7_50145 [Trebonia sp.]